MTTSRDQLVRNHTKSLGRRCRAGIFIGVFLLSLLGIFSMPASAQSATEFGIEPYNESPTSLRTRFEIDAHPGDVFVDQIRLTNRSATPQEFLLFTSDGYNTEDGIFSLRLPDEQGVMPELNGIGKWATLPLPSILVGPNEAKKIPVTIRFPDNAPPGEHWGGVLAIPKTSVTENNGGLAIQVRNALGVRIVANMSGEKHSKLSISGRNVSTSQSWSSPFGSTKNTKISYRISNNGNVAASGTVTVVIRDTLNRVVMQKNLPQIQTLIPGNSAKYEKDLGELGAIGPLYRVEVVATVGDQTYRSNGMFFVMPWLIVIIIGLLVLRRLTKSRSKYLETVKKLREERKKRSQENADAKEPVGSGTSP